MRDTPLNTSQEVDAIDHAIEVHLDHYHEMVGEDAAVVLEDARETMSKEEYIPAEAVYYVWEILMEHSHLKIASDPDYNNGIDRDPLINVVYNIIAFNGDEVHEHYDTYRMSQAP